jgi:hypothetical protein
VWAEVARELIEAAGGEVVFSELRNCLRALDRIVTSDEVIRRQPTTSSQAGVARKPILMIFASDPVGI